MVRRNHFRFGFKTFWSENIIFASDSRLFGPKTSFSLRIQDFLGSKHRFRFGFKTFVVRKHHFRFGFKTFGPKRVPKGVPRSQKGPQRVLKRVPKTYTTQIICFLFLTPKGRSQLFLLVCLFGSRVWCAWVPLRGGISKIS